MLDAKKLAGTPLADPQKEDAPPRIEIAESDVATLLQPNGKLHADLVDKIKSRLKMAQDAATMRYATWDEVDEKVRLFMDLSGGAKRGDGTINTDYYEMPFERSIVVPVSYSVLQVRLTQLMAILLEKTPLWCLSGAGPEDVTSAKLMEAVLDYDMRMSASLLSLYQQMQDAEKYGVGIIFDSWEAEHGWQRPQPTGAAALIKRVQETFGITVGPPPRVWDKVREYNRWTCIDPYRFWCDPRVPKSDLQMGEFAGHRIMRSYLYLMERSTANKGPYFNLNHLSNTIGKCKSHIPKRDMLNGGVYDQDASTDTKDKGYYVIDLIQIKLIPREWGLGGGTKPEIWWFALANESLIVRAHPSAYDHGQYTYGVIEANLDTHALYNPGNLENLDGMQRFMDWLLNSHIENIRKSLNDALIYAPSLIEEDDILNPGPARHIRLTAEGEQRLLLGQLPSPKAAVEQLIVGDMTGAHLQAFQLIFDMVQRMTGINDTVMAMPNDEKKTLGEVNQTLRSAQGRTALQFRLYESMGFVPMVYRAINNRQQFTEAERYYQIAGDAVREFGADRILVKPEALQGNFDYIVRSELMGPDPARTAMVWTQLVMGLMKVPQLFMAPGPDGQVLSLHRIFDEVAKNMGVKNIKDFYEQAPPPMPPQNVQVMPDEQVANGVKRGNMVPMGPEPRLPGMPGMTP